MQIDYLKNIIDNLPRIIEVLKDNNNGLIAIVWIVAAVALYFVLNTAPWQAKLLALLVLFGGIVFLVWKVLDANREVNATEMGWTFYQVHSDGSIVPPDGRLQALNGQRRLYNDLRVGDDLKVDDPKDGAYFYAGPSKQDFARINTTEPYACLRILELGHPLPADKLQDRKDSAGYVRVKVIGCPG